MAEKTTLQPQKAADISGKNGVFFRLGKIQRFDHDLFLAGVAPGTVAGKEDFIRAVGL